MAATNTEGLKPHQFKPGNPGGPGRPKGARSKLGELFLTTMLEDFNKHGVEAIQKVRVDDPSTYLRVVSNILPKEITGEDGAALIGSITVNFVRPDSSSS